MGRYRVFLYLSKCASTNITYNLIELRLREHTASHASYNRYAQLKKKKIKFNKKRTYNENKVKSNQRKVFMRNITRMK